MHVMYVQYFVNWKSGITIIFIRQDSVSFVTVKLLSMHDEKTEHQNYEMYKKND